VELKRRQSAFQLCSHPFSGKHVHKVAAATDGPDRGVGPLTPPLSVRQAPRIGCTSMDRAAQCLKGLDQSATARSRPGWRPPPPQGHGPGAARSGPERHPDRCWERGGRCDRVANPPRASAPRSVPPASPSTWSTCRRVWCPIWAGWCPGLLRQAGSSVPAMAARPSAIRPDRAAPESAPG
jgi:hypothetical protein